MSHGRMAVDRHSLDHLEFGRVLAACAARCRSEGGRRALETWLPISDPLARRSECECLGEALRRTAEPDQWCFAGPEELRTLLDLATTDPIGAEGLMVVLRWLEAGEATQSSWEGAAQRQRFPRLTELVEDVTPPTGLRARLDGALDPDGQVRDQASPKLARLRSALKEGERGLERRLERWARAFGSDTYVTRHADRFVALVPAQGFSRSRGIVHGVSGSAQSLFVEPLEFCEANNGLIEARAEAAAEERRILLELSGLVTAASERLGRMEAALVHLDTLAARARWANEFGGVALLPGGDFLRLKGARHPLLAMAAGGAPREVVPLDLDLGTHETGGPGRLLLVSGPNMGGKTVLLKTVGLAVLSAQAALPVLAEEGSRLPEIERVLVDLGDDQSVDQGLSTFAAHLSVLARMAAAAGPRTLVLCDELGAGTDPDEGGALGWALVEHLAERGTWGVATTHLGKLKRLAVEVPGVAQGSLEFDLETLAPRYRFLPGVPGASHALSVAERLGFPAEVLARARSLTPESTRAIEKLSGELALATERARERAEGLEAATRKAEQAAAEHHEAADESRRQAASLRKTLGREAEAILARARELWQTVQREARRTDKDRATAEALRAEIVGLEREATELHAGAEVDERAGAALSAPEIVTGRMVRILDLGVDAEVVGPPDAEGRVALRRGAWTIQSRVGRLATADAATPQPTRPLAGTWSPADQPPPLQVDLRGMDVDEALTVLDGGLDRAAVAGLLEFRIVHGIGRGVLRSAVERHLRSHPHVAEQRLGGAGEGGRGVTVARLR